MIFFEFFYRDVHKALVHKELNGDSNNQKSTDNQSYFYKNSQNLCVKLTQIAENAYSFPFFGIINAAKAHSKSA